jgi:OHCU decarboxylase
MIARRPFASEESLIADANEAWDETGPDDWHEAFSHHPKIGDKVSGKEAAEQAGAQSAAKSVKEELADINREYEKKFGHIYIVCASGKSAEEMLQIAQERMHNNPSTELRIAAEEQRKIMELRLRKLCA